MKFIVKFSVILTFLFSFNDAFSYRVIAFGDSITQGFQRNSSRVSYNCTKELNGLTGAQTSCGYARKLERLLANNYPGSVVLNYGWHGENATTGNGADRNYRFRNGLARFKIIIDSELRRAAKPEVVLIMEGTNDLARRRSSEFIEFALNEMVKYAKSKGVEPVIATLTPRTDGRVSQSRMNTVNNYIKGIARDNRIPLADQFNKLGGFNGFGPYHSGDRLHISNLGYTRMAEEWSLAIDNIGNRSSVVPIFNLLLLND